MQRVLHIGCLAACLAVLAVPAGAAAASLHRVTGVVTYVDDSQVTIQTAGRRTGVVNALTMAANAVASRSFPYVWGGGHAAAGVADAGGVSGRGHHPIGYDCSGAVAAVLAGAGLWAAGSGVPNEAGMITQLMHERLIARGPSSGATGVTLYDNPGVHIFMNVDGRFFGTSDGGGGGNRNGGAGWLSDGAPDAYNPRFKQFHFLPSVLRDSTVYGHNLTFTGPAVQQILYGLSTGDKLDVAYTAAGAGVLLARSATYSGAITTSGTVLSIAADGSSFVVQTPGGKQITLSAAKLSQPIDGLQVGDTVQATYTRSGAQGLIARGLQVTATPAPVPVPAPTPPTTATGSTTAGSTTGSGTAPMGTGTPTGGYDPGSGADTG
jgi:hypothetical protein